MTDGFPAKTEGGVGSGLGLGKVLEMFVWLFGGAGY